MQCLRKDLVCRNRAGGPGRPAGRFWGVSTLIVALLAAAGSVYGGAQEASSVMSGDKPVKADKSDFTALYKPDVDKQVPRSEVASWPKEELVYMPDTDQDGYSDPEGSKSMTFHNPKTKETFEWAPLTEEEKAVLQFNQGGYDGYDGWVEPEDMAKSFGNMTVAGSLDTWPRRGNVKLAMRFVDTGGTNRFFVCSGTMADAGVVLTAAHCVYSRNPTLSNGTTINIFDWAEEVWVIPAWDGNGNTSPPDDITENFGWARGTAYLAGTDYINNGNFDRDCGLVRLGDTNPVNDTVRSVGMLTGWFGWAHSGCPDNGRTYHNFSYPAEGCSATLHTGATMYYWNGTFDSCPLFSNQARINTSGGCFNAGWGGMSGSGAYYVENSNRYVHAVSSNSNRSTRAQYCILWEEFVTDMQSFENDTRTNTFDLEPLMFRFNAGSTTVNAGSNLPSSTVQMCNATNYNPGSRNFTITVRLSNNNNISTGDTLLATYNFNNINFAAMQSRNWNIPAVTVPANTPPGNYWVGVVLNNGTDANDGNNDTDTWDAEQITVLCPSVSTATNVAATDGTYTNRVRVTWSASSGANQYEIWRNTSSSTTGRTLIATDTASPYDDYGAVPGDRYYYWVRAKNQCGNFGGYSSWNSGWRAITPPTVTATDGTYKDRIFVDWAGVFGASHYRVFRNTSNTTAGAVMVQNWTTATSYNDYNVTPLQTYYYFVRAAADAFGSFSSNYSSSDSGYRAADCDTPPTYDYLIFPGANWGTTPVRSYIEHGCHVYRLYLQAKNSYDFSLCSNDGSGASYSGDGNGNMTMYNWQGSYLWGAFGDDSCGDNATTIGTIREGWRPPSDGIYFLRVYDAQDEPADYQLAYRCVCAAPEDLELPNPANEQAAVAHDHILAWGSECKPVDDFNRPDGSDMGPKWIERAGNTALQYNLATATANASLMTFEDGTPGNHICADVYASGSGLQYAALVTGYANVNRNVFVKLQGTGQFSTLYFYFGNNGSGSGWDNEGSFTLPEPIWGAHMSCHLVGDRIIVELDTNWDGEVDLTYERGGLPMHLLGKGSGVGFWGTTPPWVDNFGIAAAIEKPFSITPPILPIGLKSVEAQEVDQTQDPDYVEPAQVAKLLPEDSMTPEGQADAGVVKTLKAAGSVVVNPDALGGAWTGKGPAPVEVLPAKSEASDKGIIIIPTLPGMGELIDFDDNAAPCFFANTTRLTGAYAHRGVTFAGPGGNDGGAILDECGAFGVTGHSAPNFLAFNPSLSMSDGGVPQGPETLTFNKPMQYVHAKVGTGSTTSGSGTIYAYDADGLMVDSDSRFMTSTMQSIAVSGYGIVRVEIVSNSGSYWVLDDLFFTDRCIDLAPPGITGYTASNIGEGDRHIAVQVDETVTVSSLGIRVGIDVLSNMSVAIREVEDGVRGQVLAAAVKSVTPGNLDYHHIPIAFEFRPGVVYDIAFNLGGGWNASAGDMEFFSFNNPSLAPANAYQYGPFQVLDGGFNNSYANSVTPRIVACVEEICPTLYDVYMGTDNPPTTLVCEGTDKPFCKISPDLASCETFYWQVVATNCCGQKTSPVWTFSTKHLLDVNADDIVNYLDFQVFENHYGANNCGPDGWCGHSDVTKDGRTDFDDVWYLCYYWLTQCGIK